MNWRIYLAGLALVSLVAPATAQTFNGNALAYLSSGAASGNAWTLSQDGYVGTYIKLDQPGDVTISAQADGQAGSNADPNMNFVLADSKFSFDVTPGTTLNTYSHTFNLPAGTYFLQTEFNNQDAANDRKLTVGSLSISGATVENLPINNNVTNQQTNDGYALAAANDYITNYRQGPAQLTLTNAVPGSMVHVKLKEHAFNFGTEVGGTSTASVNTFLNNSSYNNFLTSHFNTVTQGNAGKWDTDEPTQGNQQMGGSDQIMNFAAAKGLRDREHNLIWGSQQPGWVNTLLTNAQSTTNPTLAASAKASLSSAITSRIAYYLSNADTVDLASDKKPRATHYVEMDVLNEELHQGSYWKIFGAAGIANIFNQVAAAVTAAGGNTRLAMNEYNVLQFSSDRNSISDPYANWFRNDVEAVRNAGGAISAIGVQYYPTHASGTNDHSPARMAQTFANLAVTGLPLSLTEFGVQANNSSVGGGAPTAALAATYLTDTMRLTFGNPNFTTFDMWGFWANDMWSQAPYAALVDANFNLTAAGIAYEDLLGIKDTDGNPNNGWTTDVTLPVDQNGNINFTGFYGDYDVTIAGQTYHLNLGKGTTAYSLTIHTGDYNGDGIVDAADYAVWRETVGSTSDLRADGNGDGTIDAGDYDVWTSTFGTSYLSGSAAASATTVPEPGTFPLFILGAISMWIRFGAKRN